MERSNYVSKLEFNSFFPSDYSKFTYQGEKSYFLCKDNSQQQLNSDDAIVLNVNLISQDSTTFTVRLISFFFSFADSFYRLHTEAYFANLVGHPVLFAHKPSSKFKVLKGNISAISFDTNSKLNITVTIESATTADYASFSNKLLSDNGSMLAYWFARIGANLPYLYFSFYHQEVLFQNAIFCSVLGRSLKVNEYNPLLPSGVGEIVDLPDASGIFLQDNVIGNKIYRTQYTRGESYSGNKASPRFIEEWHILEGLIKYSGKVRKISPLPSRKNGASVIAMSYHP